MASSVLERRRIYLVNKGLQLKFTGVILALSIIYFAGFAFVAIVFQRTESQGFVELLSRCQQSVGDLPERFQTLDRSLTAQMLGIMGALIAVLAVFGVLLTHKIAGPIYRFQKVVEEIRGGKAARPVTLRKGDELTGLAADVNEMISILNSSRQRDAEVLGQLKTRARDLASRLPPGGERDAVASMGSEIEGLLKAKGLQES